MAKYLISFPSPAMVVPDGAWDAVGRDAHAVIDQAKAAGVYIVGGGVDADVPPALVSADGTVAAGGYPWAPPLDGGITVLELPSREEAIAWAARIAKAAGATFGRVITKRQTIFGYKLQLLVTLYGVILDFELVPANVADISAGYRLLAGHQDLIVIGDKAYIGQARAAELRAQTGTVVVTSTAARNTSKPVRP